MKLEKHTRHLTSIALSLMLLAACSILTAYLFCRESMPYDIFIGLATSFFSAAATLIIVDTSNARFKKNQSLASAKQLLSYLQQDTASMFRPILLHHKKTRKDYLAEWGELLNSGWSTSAEAEMIMSLVSTLEQEDKLTVLKDFNLETINQQVASSVEFSLKRISKTIDRYSSSLLNPISLSKLADFERALTELYDIIELSKEYSKEADLPILPEHIMVSLSIALHKYIACYVDFKSTMEELEL